MTRPDTTSTSAAMSALRYQLPRPAGAVWLGLRLNTLIVLAVSLAAAIGLVVAGAPAPVAAALLGTALLVALVPVADRPVLQWLGPVARHLTRPGGRVWSADPNEPFPSGAASRHGRRPARPPADVRVRLVLPPECGRVHAVALAEDSTAAVAALHHAGRRTVVLEVCGAGGFGLLDPDGQDTQLAGWGGCLDAVAADTRILNVQWLTHTRPATCWPQAEPAGETEGGTEGPLACDNLLLADYEHLEQTATQQAWHHTHLLAVTLRPAAQPGAPRVPHAADRTSEQALLEQIRDVTSQLLTADLLARPLSLDELGATLRMLTEPDLPQQVSFASPLADLEVRRQAWGIRCRRAGWDAVRTGDSWHRTYAVSSWPSLPLSADWLARLLTAAPPDGTSRTLSVHAKPVATVHAARQARAAAAKAHLDASDRRRFGLTGEPGGPSVGDDQRAHDAAALEAELAAGYRMLSTRALVTISATDPQRLAQATSSLRTTAATHRIDLRPLHGRHHDGLVATLPLGLLPGSGR